MAVWIRRATKARGNVIGFARTQVIRADDDAAVDWLSA
jgi:hypothetical protein